MLLLLTASAHKKRVSFFVFNALPGLDDASLISKETPMICPCYVCFNGNQIDLKIWDFAYNCEK